jgi:hypothetical protein
MAAESSQSATLGPFARGRRALLARLVAVASVTVTVLAAGLSWRRRRRGPRERELSEANFYEPHDLAG